MAKEGLGSLEGWAYTRLELEALGAFWEHFVFMVHPRKAHRMNYVSVRSLKRYHTALLAAAAAMPAGPSKRNNGALEIFRPAERHNVG